MNGDTKEYRRIAREIATTAERVQEPGVRARYFKLAAKYEWLAYAVFVRLALERELTDVLIWRVSDRSHSPIRSGVGV